VNFLQKHNQWQATELTRVELVGERVLTPDRFYVVDLEFDVPESDNNAGLGVWMVQVPTLYSLSLSPQEAWD
jgi:hypothetical protein